MGDGLLDRFLTGCMKLGKKAAHVENLYDGKLVISLNQLVASLCDVTKINVVAVVSPLLLSNHVRVVCDQVSDCSNLFHFGMKTFVPILRHVYFHFQDFLSMKMIVLGKSFVFYTQL